MSFDYKITVFTPTYNRAYIIENLYRSIQRQTYRDFEWVVVDDGSSDGTEELFRKWQAERNDFPIRYVKQENGGKCRAINRGMTEARGELFFNIDSDDYLTDDALEKIARWEAELPKDSNFCGFSANLGFSPTETPNTLFEQGFLDGNAFDRYGAANGERAMIFYTDIMRKYPYPEFPGEKFMTEAVPMMEYLLKDDIEFDEKSVEKILRKEGKGAKTAIVEGAKLLETCEWTTEAIEAALRGLVEKLESKPRLVFQPLRVAVTGNQVSPPLFESIELLSRETVQARMAKAAELALD